jgi:hypothetical protein
VIIAVEDDHATLIDVEAARERAVRRVRRYIPAGVSLSEELMAERKEEAARE